MRGEFDGTLTGAEIARAANVRPSAVNNWAARHDDFPLPRYVDGQERYRIIDVANWLSKRKVPRNALGARELHGTTYGERFLSNLGLDLDVEQLTSNPSGGSAPDNRSAPGSADTRQAERIASTVWRAMDRLRGTADVTTSLELLLGMFYLRSRDPSRWTEIARMSEADAGFAVDRAMRDSQGEYPNVRGAHPQLYSNVWDSRDIADVVRLLDALPVDRREGGRALGTPTTHAFRLMLEWLDRPGLEFVTPESLSRTVVEMLEPQVGERIYDPCCGTGGLLVEAAAFIGEEPDDRLSTTSFHGQAIIASSWRIARLHMAINGIVADLGDGPANALRGGLPSTAPFDVVLANPPFNMSQWSHGDPWQDGRWRYGVPPIHNANFAWLQHVAGSLSPRGRAAVVMANGSTTSEHAGEGAIREAIVEGGLVECIVALPSRLFRQTGIPVTVWILRHPEASAHREILLIDATASGEMVDRKHRALTDGDRNRIVGQYRAWRRRPADQPHVGIEGFSISVPIENIRDADFRLNPRAYVSRLPRASDPQAALRSLSELESQLELLRQQATEVDVDVSRQLREIRRWRR